MLSTTAPGVDVERLLAEADAALRRAAPRPAPPLPELRTALWAAAVRARIKEARSWAASRPAPGGLANRAWPVRALLRALAWPLWPLLWPQRRFNRAVLGAIELLLDPAPPPAGPHENGACR